MQEFYDSDYAHSEWYAEQGAGNWQALQAVNDVVSRGSGWSKESHVIAKSRRSRRNLDANSRNKSKPLDVLQPVKES